MTTECPIAYDHTEDLEKCMVCGWTEATEVHKDQPLPPKTGLERIQEAIKILNGGYAPKNPVLICGGPERRPVDDLDGSFAAYHESRSAE